MPRVSAVQVKSKAPGPFKSTKAERIDKMYAEAKVFSQHVEKVEKKIRNLQVATAGELDWQGWQMQLAQCNCLADRMAMMMEQVLLWGGAYWLLWRRRQWDGQCCRVSVLCTGLRCTRTGGRTDDVLRICRSFLSSQVGVAWAAQL